MTFEDRKEGVINILRFWGRPMEGVVFGGGGGLKDVGGFGRLSTMLSGRSEVRSL